jgi:Uma2 family endonuclease
MRELMRNGAQLGWLIDPQRRAVHVYSPAEPVQTLLAPSSVSAEPLLRGFVLDLEPIF